MSPSRRDFLFLTSLKLIGGGVVVMLLAMLVFLLRESWPVVSTQGLSMLTGSEWFPSDQLFGLWPMLLGSLLVVSGALLLSLPAGVLTALFIVYFAPSGVARLSQRIVELLAGLPSVIYGFWGIVVVVPLLQQLGGPGTSLLAGIVVLGIMILPLMTLLAITRFRQLDPQQLQAAWCLGLSRSTMVWQLALPLARRGLFNGAILQTARALGETMAVLMVCGNVVAVPDSLLAPVRTLTANIALEAAYAMHDHRAALFSGGLVLCLSVSVLLLIHRSGGQRSYVS